MRANKYRANARMIAASPYMLAACIAALSQLTQDRPEYLEGDIERLRDAIEKATGKNASGFLVED